MNTSFEEMADAIGAAAAWDKFPADMGASVIHEYAKQLAYQSKPSMTMTEPKVLRVDAIVAGVRSCLLAAQVLRLHHKDDRIDARLAVVSARSVLDCWGIDITNEPPPAEPNEPEDSQVELVWPPVDLMGRPRFATLPDVYRENYYHVHERLAVPQGTYGLAIDPVDRLILHDAYWSEEALQWRMKMSIGGSSPDFWVNHCQVRPGDELPQEPPQGGA